MIATKKGNLHAAGCFAKRAALDSVSSGLEVVDLGSRERAGVREKSCDLTREKENGMTVGSQRVMCDCPSEHIPS